MAGRRVKIGVLQVSSHPAVVVGDIDLLAEPFLPSDKAESISLLARERLDVGTCLDSVRTRYIEWQRRRLSAVFDWLASHEAPDILALPECSVPYECLDLTRSFARTTKTVVLAGTHTLRRGTSAFEDYRSLGVRERNCNDVLASKHDHASVLPIIWEKETALHAKGAPSVFELTDLDLNDPTPIPVRTIPVGSPKLAIATLVCAEALRLPQYPNKKPEAAFIIARERQPQRFDPHASILLANGTPVALVNDGRFGGSFVRAAFDRRVLSWWFDSPVGGVLPIGEYYLEVEVDVQNSAVEVGVSAPSTTARLVRVVPLLDEGAGAREIEHKMLRAAQAEDAVTIEALLREQRHTDVALQAARWRYVATKLRSRTLTPEVLGVVAPHVPMPGGSLDQLEQELARLATKKLDEVLERSPQDLPDETVGRVYRATRALKRHSSTPGEDPGGPAPSVLPIGRSVDIDALRDYATKRRERLATISGLEGIGKSSVVAAALAQAATRHFRVTCVPGMSADTLFEYLIRGGDRIASGQAPRGEFSADELAEALRRFDVVWLENCHNLLEGPSWRTHAIDGFMHALVVAAGQSAFRLVLESRRKLPLRLASTPTFTRRIRGLATADAVAVLDARIRRYDAAVPELHESTLKSVAELVKGHPGLLALCAEAAAREGLPSVVEDLKARRGFYLAAVQSLVESLALTAEEKTVLRILSDCRVPVPIDLVSKVVESGAAVVGGLVEACLLDRPEPQVVVLAPIIADAAAAFPDGDEPPAKEFHLAVSEWFASQAATASTLRAFRAATEANYHATLIGHPPPCKLSGIYDDLLAVTRREQQRENFSRVVEILSVVVDGTEQRNIPEDLMGMYAEALAWSGDFERALEVADHVVGVNDSYKWLYVDAARAALHSHNDRAARRALERADSHGVALEKVSLLKGRLAERTGDSEAAITHFHAAAAAADRDAWPAFYLSRALIRRGEYEDAIEAAGSGRDITARSHGRKALHLENALMQQEMLALFMLDRHELAQVMLRVLEKAPDPRAEVVVCAAYLRAYYETAEQPKQAMQHFERALQQLDKETGVKHHMRAQIGLFRGKLRERMGDVEQAKAEYEQALETDPENMHMHLSLLRAASALRDRAAARQDRVAVAESNAEIRRIANKILKMSPGRFEAQRALSSAEDSTRR